MVIIEWDLLVAADLFLSGLGAGAYIVGTLADIKGGKEYEKLGRFGSHLSWPLVLMGLVVLILHMERPGLNEPAHIMNTFSNLPSSMLTIEALLSGAFIAIGAATSFLWLAKWKRIWLRTIIEIMGIAVALSLIVSSGFVLALSRGRPLWESSFLPWIFTISAIIAGLALVGLTETHLGSMLFPRFTVKPELKMLNLMTRLASVLIVMLSMVTFGYLVDVTIVGKAMVGLSNLILGSTSWVFWSSLVIGFVVPVGIRVSVAKRVKEPDTEMGIKLLSLVSFLCIIIGVFALRYAIMVAGQL